MENKSFRERMNKAYLGSGKSRPLFEKNFPTLQDRKYLMAKYRDNFEVLEPLYQPTAQDIYEKEE